MIAHAVGIAPIYPPGALLDASEAFARQGFAVLDRLYPDAGIGALLGIISESDSTRPSFRKTAGLFAIRQFLKEVPDAAHILLNDALQGIIGQLAGTGYFAVKSIYFDKPQASNWFVSYHQDLSISVDRRVETAGFGPWTTRQDQYGVQPPLPILQDNLTVRIHLDDTSSENGALRVVPGSHHKGIYRPETIDWSEESEVVCEVPKGGIMLMRPLLLHASDRSTNNAARRVVHIEFSRQELPEPLRWAERI